MRDKRGAYKIWSGDLKGRDPLEDVSVDGRIIPKATFKKWDGEAQTGMIWLRIGTGGRRL
jgi:hypothetical protein